MIALKCAVSVHVYVNNYVTVSEKTDHSVQNSDVEDTGIYIPCCSALFNNVVRIAIVYTVLELCASRYRHLKILLAANL